MEMEAVDSSRMLVVVYQTTWYRIPEDSLNTFHENLISLITISCFFAIDYVSSPHHQTSSGAHPASYPMGTEGSFPRGKVAGA
jgi:hypothetical protein